MKMFTYSETFWQEFSGILFLLTANISIYQLFEFYCGYFCLIHMFFWKKKTIYNWYVYLKGKVLHYNKQRIYYFIIIYSYYMCVNLCCLLFKLTPELCRRLLINLLESTQFFSRQKRFCTTRSCQLNTENC